MRQLRLPRRPPSSAASKRLPGLPRANPLTWTRWSLRAWLTMETLPCVMPTRAHRKRAPRKR
eukprot:12834306-Alexandrium_andersonii.AAC.1